MNEVSDAVRRTYLANERTYLAWWRTGLAAMTVALAAARVVPELANAGTRWPYDVLGAGFAVLGVACVVHGERRRAAVDRATATGEFGVPAGAETLWLTVAGVVLGLGLLAVVVIGP